MLLFVLPQITNLKLFFSPQSISLYTQETNIQMLLQGSEAALNITHMNKEKWGGKIGWRHKLRGEKIEKPLFFFFKKGELTIPVNQVGVKCQPLKQELRQSWPWHWPAEQPQENHNFHVSG